MDFLENVKGDAEALLKIEEFITEMIGYKKRDIDTMRKKTGVDKMELELARLQKAQTAIHNMTSDEDVIKIDDADGEAPLALYNKFYKHRDDVPRDVKMFIDNMCRRHMVNEGKLRSYIEELEEKDA